MKYRNRKTGAIIETDSKLSGVWEVYEPSNNPVEKDEFNEEIQEEVQEEVKQENKSNKKSNSDFKTIDDVTVAEIKQELEAFGINYNPKATKAELWKLMKESR